MQTQQLILLLAVGAMMALLAAVSFLSNTGSLDGVKAKTVGDGQHGEARWATDAEIGRTFARMPFRVSDWRAGKNLPQTQGLILGSVGGKGRIAALVDGDDIHCVRFVS